ncbi:MAG: cyclic nucleotide-binding domain-containing protein, partial [Rubrivivax sp.]|nr:cyclic nucleotide-binding domain-containing protein [Rubrivivax sp.]
QHLRFAGLRPVHAETAGSPVEAAPQRPRDHQRPEDRLLAIEHVPLLSVLTVPELERLAAASRVCRVAESTAVVTSGEAGSTMFIVAAGVLEVLMPDTEGAAAHRIATLAPGQFFGEMSLLTGALRTATVKALSACVLYEVPHAVMAELLQARPDLADQLSGVVAEHLRRDNQAAQLADNTPQARAASLPEAIAQRIRRFLSR